MFVRLFIYLYGYVAIAKLSHHNKWNLTVFMRLCAEWRKCAEINWWARHTHTQTHTWIHSNYFVIYNNRKLGMLLKRWIKRANTFIDNRFTYAHPNTHKQRARETGKYNRLNFLKCQIISISNYLCQVFLFNAHAYQINQDLNGMIWIHLHMKI